MSPEKLEKIRLKLEFAESTKGSPFPQAAVAPILQLVDAFDNIDVVIGNPQRSVSDIRYMQKTLTHDAFIFWDEHGDEFKFSDEAWPIKYNRKFAVARLSPDKMKIWIYARF